MNFQISLKFPNNISQLKIHYIHSFDLSKYSHFDQVYFYAKYVYMTLSKNEYLLHFQINQLIFSLCRLGDSMKFETL